MWIPFDSGIRSKAEGRGVRNRDNCPGKIQELRRSDGGSERIQTHRTLRKISPNNFTAF